MATNIAPSVTITGQPAGSVLEGTIITLTANASDPGGASDFLTYLWNVTGPDGLAQSGNGQTITFVPNESGSYTANVTVTDSDNATGSDSTTISIAHVRPIATVRVDAANTYIQSGGNLPSTLHVSLIADVPDPGKDDAFAYTWTATDLDSGVPTVQSGNSPDFMFSGPAEDNFSVTLAISDDDGGNETVNVPLDIVQAKPGGFTFHATDIAGASQIVAIAIISNLGDTVTIDGNAVTEPFVAAAVGNGHATLIGGQGTNVLQGDSGFNSLLGGSGPNTLFGTANDTLVGGTGTNTNPFNLTPGVGEVVRVGSTGNTLSFTQATAPSRWT